MKVFVIYSVYPNKDDIYGDAWEYHLELNSIILAKYGDNYHDKGLYKSLGFIDGYAYAKGWKEKEDYIIKRDKRVDRNIE